MYFTADNHVWKVKDGGLPSKINGDIEWVILGQNGKPIAVDELGSIYWPDDTCIEWNIPKESDLDDFIVGVC